MAMFHSMTIAFSFETEEDLTGIIQYAIQDDESRDKLEVSHTEGNNTYTVSYCESGYCQVSEVLSYAQIIAGVRPSICFTMDAWAQNEGSGGNYTDNIIVRYFQGVLWHEYYSSAEAFSPEIVAFSNDERLVSTDVEQIFIDEETKEACWECVIQLPSVCACSEISEIKYDENVFFKLPPEYYVSKSEYDAGMICLAGDGTENEESFTCELKLLPLNQKFINNTGIVKYYRLQDSPEAVVSCELSKGRMFDEYRKSEEGYPVILKLDVQVPQGYILELESMPFVYEGKSKELEQQHLTGFRRMLDVFSAIRINGEPLEIGELTPETLKSVIAPSPEDHAVAVDVSDKLHTGIPSEAIKPLENAKSTAKASPEERKWLKEYGKYVESKPEIEFGGKIFAFTGLDAAGSFADESNPIVLSVVSKGGIYRSKVSGKTNYLVVNPKYAGKSKVDAALEQRAKGKDIKIILLEDLKELL